MQKLLRRALAAASVGALTFGLVAAPLAAQQPHWDYYSHGGPEHWGDEFPSCTLPSQSPVDIAGVAPRTGLAIDYRPTPLVVFNNDHTIQVAHERGSWLTIDGKRYELLQLHFHAPSEHTFAGAHAPLEAHFVHLADDGELAVLGVLMREGAANEAFDAVLDQMPQTPGNSASLRSFDASALLPDRLSFYAYEGSLTTPPCSGGVRWHVLSETVSISAAQLAEFRSLAFLSHDGHFVGNARPVQPLEGRLGDPAPRISAPSTGNGGLAADR